MQIYSRYSLDMTVTGTGKWIDRIMKELNWTNRTLAVTVLRTVLQIIRDGCAVEEIDRFAARLPIVAWMLFKQKDVKYTEGSPLEQFLSSCSGILENGVEPLSAMNAVVRIIRDNVDHSCIPEHVSGLLA